MRRFAVLTAAAVLFLAAAGHATPPPSRNVIVLIPDGASFSLVTLARWMNGGPLALDAALAGAVRTASASSVITDSAAAATAIATGHSTDNRVVGLAPCGAAAAPPCRAPLATVLEAAKLAGLATGLVATSHIGHATPAGFATHVESRNDYQAIAEQLVHQDLDVVLGGGRRDLLPAGAGGARADGADLVAVLQARGVQVVGTAQELAAVTRGRVWGAFADIHLAAELDRPRLAPQQPDLAAMTRKAIELLAAEGRGFLLMVEGSQVDWGLHDNDAAAAVAELLAFDAAAAAALEFAARNGNTLVMAFADHGTGGVAIGNRRTDATWSRTFPADVTAPLRGMHATARAVADAAGPEPTGASLAAAVQELWGIALTPGEAAAILAARDRGLHLAEALGRAVSESHTVVGWTTFEHEGGDVPLWSFGPGRPTGLLANTELAPAAAAFLGLDLAAAQAALYVDAAAAFPDAVVERPEGDDPALVAGPCRVPANRDLVRCAGLAPVEVEGVAVHVGGPDRFYLPRGAVAAIERARAGGAPR